MIPWFFWLFPVAFAIHNAEEALCLPAFSKSAGGDVRIQRDRGHQVVSHGPYRMVRHPGYVAIAPIGR